MGQGWYDDLNRPILPFIPLPCFLARCWFARIGCCDRAHTALQPTCPLLPRPRA